MNKQLKYLILIYIIVALLATSSVIVRKNVKTDLKFMKLSILNNKCNNWCLSHLIMYIFLGFYAPKYWYISIILSILWEFTELYLEKFNIYISSNLIDDNITNAMGLIIGIILNKIIL